MKSVEDYKNSRNSVSVKYTEFNSLKTRFPNHFLLSMKERTLLISIVS